MKYLFILILAVMISGCASISEYNQGCRDGISYVVGNDIVDHKKVNDECNDLDAAHRQKEKMERQGSSGHR